MQISESQATFSPETTMSGITYKRLDANDCVFLFIDHQVARP